MPRLTDPNLGRTLVPSTDPLNQLLLGTFGTRQSRAEEERKRQQEEAIQRDIDILSGGIVAEQPTSRAPEGSIEGAGGITGVEPRISRISQLAGPQVAQQFNQTLQSGDLVAIDSARQEADKGLETASIIKAETTFAGKQRALREEAAKAAANGEDVTRFVELSNLPEQNLDLELQKMEIVGKDIRDGANNRIQSLLSDPRKRAAFIRLAAQNPQAAEVIRKAEADRLGSPTEQFVPVLNEQGQIVAQQSTTTGKVVSDPRATKGLEGGDFSKSPGVIVQTPEGFAQSIPSFNKQTGQFEEKIVPITGQPVSRLGETPGQIQARTITTEGGKVEAAQAAVTEALPDKTKVEATAKRRQGNIDRAFVAADTISTFNRGIELLDSVETGGFDAAALRAKQLFGIESADEAELSNSLGKAVLAQLRDTFGAAFTAQEGASLKEIEAGFGKSVAGNRALLKRAKRIAQRAVDRGVKSARDIGDEQTALEIEEAAAFQLVPTPSSTTGRFQIEVVQ